MWKFLSVEENREILYFIGGVMAALAIAIWQIYVHFSDKKTSDGLTEEKLEAILKRRDEEIREKYAASEPGSEQRALLEKEQAALEQKRTNLEESLEAAQKVHADIIKLFNEKLTAQLPSDRIEQAKTAITKGDSALAESLLEEVVASGIQQSAEASYQLGLLAKDRVDYKKAWKTLTRAAELAPDNSLYLNETGFMAKTLGNYDTAIEYYEKSLDLDMMAHGPNHTSVAISWNNLGSAWENKGEYDKAIEYYNKALASDLKTLGSEHRNVAIYWNNLGEAYRNKGHYDKAIEYFEKALDSDLKTFGPDHTSVTTRWNNLGAAWDDKGKYDKAIGYYEKALASVLKTLGPVHPRVATYQNNLGLAWNNKGEVDKAIEYFEKA